MSAPTKTITEELQRRFDAEISFLQKLHCTFSLEGSGLTEDWKGAADAGGASTSGKGALEDERQGEWRLNRE